MIDTNRIKYKEMNKKIDLLPGGRGANDRLATPLVILLNSETVL